ncbi:class I SAM-dependent methyltransferase [Terrabacter terrae]|uniref:Class I SAM-dependent methyltransferase n=1 Tax=Terrabacter terrae TaxID=318434 RepID=A0ABP5FWX0_9MICO
MGAGRLPRSGARGHPELGRVLVDACHVEAGQDVLDVAAGSGNAAIPAALTGARVVASDLAPELLDAGRRTAEAAGVELDWRRGDAEALPFADRSFDVVMSCVGVMFAPHHEAAAAELVRVSRPGATIGLASWTPHGFIGRMFAVMKPYAAPPPPGAQPAPRWGDEGHVRDLLGGQVQSFAAEKRLLPVQFDAPEDFRDFFKRTYGPVIATYRRIADEPDEVAALDTALAGLARDAMDAQGRMDWEYLLVTARRTP